ncbi:hypothetical protein QEN19_003219 [Hanseniaspora menglaensis]
MASAFKFNQTIIITGGSQGLGLELARYHYSSEPDKIIVIISRSENKLIKACNKITENNFRAFESLENLGKNSQIRLFYQPTDLSDYEQVEKLKPLLLKLPKIARTYLTAGGAYVKLFKDHTLKELQQGINMNYSASLFLTHVLLQNNLCKHLCFFSSEVSFFPFIGYISYTPLKTSLKALVNILRQEYPIVRISNIYPGNFASEGYIEENLTKPDITKSIEGSSNPISVEECRKIIISNLNKGYDDIVTDFIGWVLMSCDMGLNKNWNYSKFWILQLFLGLFANLLIVPFYMVYLNWDIKRYLKHSKQFDDKITQDNKKN